MESSNTKTGRFSGLEALPSTFYPIGITIVLLGLALVAFTAVFEEENQANDAFLFAGIALVTSGTFITAIADSGNVRRMQICVALMYGYALASFLIMTTGAALLIVNVAFACRMATLISKMTWPRASQDADGEGIPAYAPWRAIVAVFPVAIFYVALVIVTIQMGASIGLTVVAGAGGSAFVLWSTMSIGMEYARTTDIAERLPRRKSERNL